MKGIEDVRRWHEKFFATVRDHGVRKTLRAASGDTIAVEFVDTWVGAASGEEMHGFGGEFWTMEGDRLAEWDPYFHRYPRSAGG